MYGMIILNSLLLGVGLAMDAFTVSLANGLHEPKMNRRRQLHISGIFACFQAAMPLLGWLCVHTVLTYFNAFSRCIPWIALLLLSYIGGKMLIEGIRAKQPDEEAENNAPNLWIQGIATSIDALSVGFTIAKYNIWQALLSAFIIGAVTLVICAAGVEIGKKAGMKLAGKATILGGLLLIGIGIEIFVSHLIG
jgi:putative Mn2+ efflux pump MntP